MKNLLIYSGITFIDAVAITIFRNKKKTLDFFKYEYEIRKLTTLLTN